MHFELPHEILNYIMKCNDATSANKKKLLASQTMYLNLKETQEYLGLCCEKSILDAFKGQNPKVDAIEENRLLLKALVRKEFLSSYKEVGQNMLFIPRRLCFKRKQKKTRIYIDKIEKKKVKIA